MTSNYPPHPLSGRCMSKIFLLPSAKVACAVVIIGFVFLPVILMFVSNIWMCMVAQGSTTLQKKGSGTKFSLKPALMVILVGGT